MRDILDRLRIDAGQLTIAALIQEREAAACEIERLRETVDRIRASKPPPVRTTPQVPTKAQRSEPLLSPDALLRLNDVCALVGVGRSTVYSWVASKTFPQPVKVGARAVRWKARELAAWREALDERKSS